jgi:Lon protease-like protein
VQNNVMPMFPLGMVVYPNQIVGLCVFESRFHEMLASLGPEQIFGTCLIERGHEVGGGDERSMVGTLMRIMDSQALPGGEVILRVEGISCFEIAEWLTDDPYPRALIKERCCDDVSVDEALLSSTSSAVRALRSLRSEIFPDEAVSMNLDLCESDNWLASWQLCALTPMSIYDQFKVLSLSDPNDRLRQVSEVCCEMYGDYQRLLNEGNCDDAS